MENVSLQLKIKSLCKRWEMIKENYTMCGQENHEVFDILSWILGDLEELCEEDDEN